MSLSNLFYARNRKLVWHRISDDHVLHGNSSFKSEAINIDEDYIALRLNEMWLVNSRKLWRKFYPMLHAFVSYGKQDLHDVVGPGQLRALGERNLEKMAAFNHSLAGPLACRGFELKALVGLYAVPGEDVAKALVDVVGSIANLASAGTAVGPIAGLVKDSIDKVLSLDGTSLQIGIEYTWAANSSLTTGYYVGIDATEVDLNLKTLWLDNDRRLRVGHDPKQSKPYDLNDYMVLALERHSTNPAWGTIPTVAKAVAEIEAVMASTVATDEKRIALNKAFPQLRSALDSAAELTRKDAALIAVAVAEKLKERLNAEAGVDFTKKGLGWSTSPGDVFEAVDEERSNQRMKGLTLNDANSSLAALSF